MRALITGATSGIGKELALQYAAEGVTLGLIGRREALLAELAESCRQKGAQAETYAQDVTDGPAMQATAETFLEAAGGIDLVIANAGMGSPDVFASGDASRMARVFSVNVNGVVNTLVPFVPKMKEQGSGHLVAIASMAGSRALAGHATYSASKIAVRMLMDGYAYELGTWGIHVTTVNPGFVVSELTAKNRFPMPFIVQTDKAVRRIRRAIRRRKRVYTFPLPMRFLTWVFTQLPRFVVARLPR